MAQSGMAVLRGSPIPGSSPFVSFVSLQVLAPSSVASIRYGIAVKPGHLARPVDVTYRIAYLQRRGYVVASSGRIDVPVFGLYSGTANPVTLEVQFLDGSTTVLSTTVTTAAYTDPNAVYDQSTAIRAYSASGVLGFNYFFMKSDLGSPVVVDIDGEIRWVMPYAASSQPSLFVDGGFLIGDKAAPILRRLELDGTLSESTLISTHATAFHHDFAPGKVGVLAPIDAMIAGQSHIESILDEVTASGQVVSEWDFGAILSDYMRSQGDDPSTFVRPGVDWFHMNSAIYDRSDNSIIASSRENFVIKIDYATRNIVWIFGDPTKYWYGYPSLRAKSLVLADGGLYPIGQHSLTINPDGDLMLFNNGQNSSFPPIGAPAGESRSYSVVTAYKVDATNLAARQTLLFDYGQSILARFCSSAAMTGDRSMLISYATADNFTHARLVGLDASRNVTFDFQYPTLPCGTSWSAQPISFDALALN